MTTFKRSFGTGSGKAPTTSPKAWLFVVALTLVAAGCTSYARLEPAPEATLANGSEAVASVHGVHVQLETTAWSDRDAIRRYTTPLKVTIENQSEHPVTLRYQDFSLVSEAGEVYSALPPFEIHGEIRERAGTLIGHPRFTSPAFAHHRFLVSPYYAPFYPALRPVPGYFYYDPFYYDRYYTLWREVDLPTEEMLERALPEGVIQAGGRVTGTLYFEPVEPESGTVEFRFDLVNSKDSEVFGSVSIPLRAGST